MLGAAESFVITGGVSWGLALVDSKHAGKVIAWIGTAMFSALALGAPLGSALYQSAGFSSISWTTMLLPLVILGLVIRLPPVAATRGAAPAAFLRVARDVWMPGVAAAFSSVGYGAILAFSSLLFSVRGWEPVWSMFTAYAAALIAARVVFGHLPDWMGGAKVAMIFVLVEATGLALIGLASVPGVAIAGAVLTGFGYSLVYPGLGAEAVRAAPVANRGLTMGVYTAFLDFALGITGPALGLVAGELGLDSVFLVSAAVVLMAAGFALNLLRKRL